MENDQLKEIVLEGVSETFEAFLFAEVLPQELNSDALKEIASKESFFSVRQTFEYDKKGSIICYIAQPLMEEAVDTLLMNEDEGNKNELKIDCVLEFVNSIVGSLINKFAGESHSFNLGLPELMEGEKIEYADNFFGFMINEKNMFINVNFD